MKLDLLQQNVPENCAFLIKNPKNRFYLTGFKSSAGTLLVTENKRILLVDFRYFEMAKKAVQNADVVLMTKESAQLKEYLEEINTVYVETDYLSVGLFDTYKKTFPGIRFSSSQRLVEQLELLRVRKEPEEIKRIRACQEITDAAFSYIITKIKEGMTEQKIAFELDMFIRRQGAQGNSFDTIALTGPNTSLPHGVPGNRTVCAGDFVLMDFGVYMDGYCSDMTRTVAVSHVTDRQRSVYETVLEAQKRALNAIAPGVSCETVDDAARNYIEKECGYEGCFGHGLGHGVGVEIHELPVFSPRSKTRLEPGMVITVEPGVYLENEFGVRIEDFVVMTDTGYENFTKSPKELIIL